MKRFNVLTDTLPRDFVIFLLMLEVKIVLDVLQGKKKVMAENALVAAKSVLGKDMHLGRILLLSSKNHGWITYFYVMPYGVLDYGTVVVVEKSRMHRRH